MKVAGRASFRIYDDVGCHILIAISKTEDLDAQPATFFLATQDFFFPMSSIEKLHSDFPASLKLTVLDIFTNEAANGKEYTKLSVTDGTMMVNCFAFDASHEMVKNYHGGVQTGATYRMFVKKDNRNGNISLKMHDNSVMQLVQAPVLGNLGTPILEKFVLNIIGVVSEMDGSVTQYTDGKGRERAKQGFRLTDSEGVTIRMIRYDELAQVSMTNGDIVWIGSCTRGDKDEICFVNRNKFQVIDTTTDFSSLSSFVKEGFELLKDKQVFVKSSLRPLAKLADICKFQQMRIIIEVFVIDAPSARIRLESRNGDGETEKRIIEVGGVDGTRLSVALFNEAANVDLVVGQTICLQGKVKEYNGMFSIDIWKGGNCSAATEYADELKAAFEKGIPDNFASWNALSDSSSVLTTDVMVAIFELESHVDKRVSIFGEIGSDMTLIHGDDCINMDWKKTGDKPSIGSHYKFKNALVIDKSTIGVDDTTTFDQM